MILQPSKTSNTFLPPRPTASNNIARPSLQRHTTAETTSEMDCPICLNNMTDADMIHPLQCQSKHCGYNFCMHCIENLVSASKDDFQESSDGSHQVKIYLNCPNCRSDLSETIRDTLLLRKADYLVSPQGVQQQYNWTPSQNRLHSVLHQEDVQQAIAKARKIEKEFMETHDINVAEEWSPGLGSSGTLSTIDDSEGDHSKENYDLFAINDGYLGSDSDSDDDGSYADVDECGIEMDLYRGIHRSFRLPKADRLLQKTAKVRDEMIDKTLLRGLASVMTKPEQKKATQLMVSGDISKLVEAAMMLRRMERMNDTRRTKSVSRSQLIKRSSIYGLIDEIETAHRKPRQIAAAPPPPLGRPGIPRPIPVVRHQSCVRNLENAEFLQTHPLPVRMPKYVEFEFSDLVGPCQLPHFGNVLSSVVSSSVFPASFVDDVWDGTVRDAYTRTTLMPLTGSIVRHEPPLNHKGVLNVLGEGLLDQDLGVARIDVPKSRVMIHSLQGGSSAGSQGILPGDVVTHLNGKEFRGTAKELMQAIERIVSGSAFPQVEFGECCVSLVLNAEAPVAEALRRRGNVACYYS